MKFYLSKSEAETKNFAAEILKENPDVKLILLNGDLGAGKTTFVKGIAAFLEIEEKLIKSPTYTFYNVFSSTKNTLYHFDLYRLENYDEELFLEIEEILHHPNNLVVIEWSEKLPLKNYKHLEINIDQDLNQNRVFKINNFSE